MCLKVKCVSGGILATVLGLITKKQKPLISYPTYVWTF